ncbi:phosphopantetheine-binding protein [Kurthia senegalensis]|uniref:phosphopantetheine-binding protein n=1 Tax=Kurthia senegalensis TaxID=1033740 RepID=UPI0002893A09|nr:phosphopantetheine-binding protein [Kurthia senegalensis]
MTEQQFFQVMNDYVDGNAHDLARDESLQYAGMDSMRMMMVVEAFRAAGSDVTFMELVKNPTLAHWMERIVK